MSWPVFFAKKYSSKFDILYNPQILSRSTCCVIDHIIMSTVYEKLELFLKEKYNLLMDGWLILSSFFGIVKLMAILWHDISFSAKGPSDKEWFFSSFFADGILDWNREPFRSWLHEKRFHSSRILLVQQIWAPLSFLFLDVCQRRHGKERATRETRRVDKKLASSKQAWMRSRQQSNTQIKCDEW